MFKSTADGMSMLPVARGTGFQPRDYTECLLQFLMELVADVPQEEETKMNNKSTVTLSSLSVMLER